MFLLVVVGSLWVAFGAAYHLASGGHWVLSLTGRTIMLSGVAQVLFVCSLAGWVPWVVPVVVSGLAALWFWTALRHRPGVE